MPQDSVLGSLFYILYTADIPISEGTEITTFAYDTAVLAPHLDYSAAMYNLQEATNNIYELTNKK